MEEYQNEITRIKETLEQHPEGLSITEIAGLLGINRNSVAKYMDILQIQGSVDGKKRGTSKVYYISHRLAVDSLRKVCSLPFVMLDQDTRVIEYNSPFTTLTGTSPGEIAGQPFDKLPFRFTAGDDARQTFRMAFKGIEQHVHARILTNSHEYPVSLDMIPVVFPTGKPGVAVLVEGSRDPAGNNREGEPSGNNSLVLLDNQLEYVVRYTPDGILQYVNEPYCRAIGRAREDLIGRQFKHFVTADDAERVIRNRTRLTVQYPAGMIEFRAIMANGEARWQRWWDRAIFDDRGQLTGYHSTGLDITDEIQVRTKLKKTQEMLEETIVTRTNELREINRQLYDEMAHREKMERQLLLTQFAMDNAADMVLWVNRNANVDYANKAAVTGLGYTAEEFSNLAIRELFAVAPKKSWNDVWQVLTNAGTITHEDVMVRKDKTRMPVEIVIRYMEYHNTGFACCFARDISDRARMEQTLHLANKKLNVLASLTRHDIQNKVTVLLGYLARTLKREQDPVILEYLRQQEQAALAIRDEITVTRDYKDLGTDPPEWLNIRDVVATAVAPYGQGPVVFDISLPDLFVYADRQMERVFSRMIENAVMATPLPRVIRISAHEEKSQMVISVEYGGPGICAEDKEQIFRPGCNVSGMRGLFIIREILSLTGISLFEAGETGKTIRFEMGIPPESFRRENPSPA
ncbi:PAS domain-containing protein [Methanoregula sp. UBA64]|jgi:PAS domain S-box-containing protein|uniref:PAS domain-containing protein n=1 Tax=Methanoregula sp. UBA64 TaxID=1915554 RepID=UPI0025EA0088|nr:PAS domain-containing protein [Methanoregula sp. UBA64]